MTDKELPKFVVDIAGQRFGRLTALEFSHIDERSKTAMWKFRCDCGTEFVTYGTHVRAGRTRSCGCLRAEESRRRANNAKEGCMIPVVVIRDGSHIECESLTQASRIIGVSHSTASIYLRTGELIKGCTLERIKK